MRAAVVVAHPDDEVIWAGGLILRHADWDWTVVALCRGDDADRRPKFDRVCRMLGVAGFISGLDDSDPLAPIDAEREIGGRTLEHLAADDWDLCLTHGRNGEYGHERHRQAHAVVADLVGRGLVSCARLWTFAYEAESPSGACRPASWADRRLDLSHDELAEKKRIVRDEYGYPEDGFEVRACISPEAFAIIKRGEEELAL
ncbi:MAG: PIG-L deacetylase family protein [Planctomycetota bacterium]